MKKNIFLLILTICVGISAFAQAPQGIPYQAVARSSSGSILASQPIRVRFTIHDSIAAGAVVYQETFAPTTSTLGLFNVNVGMGAVVSGTFADINWGRNAKFMQVEMDATGGTTYMDMGTQQMMSVPYALYAGAISNTFNSWGNFMLVVDKVSGCLSGGGYASTNGWQKRNLNKIIDSSGTSILFNSNSSSFTLNNLGKYYIRATAPGFNVYKHRIVIQDTMSHFNYIIGQNAYSFQGSFVANNAEAEGFVNVTSTPITFNIMHYTSGTSEHENLGVAVQDSICQQVYTKIMIQKIK